MTALAHQSSIQRDLIIDARCLQEPAFAQRGVGSHAASLLVGGLRMPDVQRAFRFVALVHPALPALTSNLDLLFAETRNIAYETPLSEAVLFAPSPMTHDPFFVSRLQDRPRGSAVALIHDFIPYDEPDRYLPTASDRVAYYARLARLRHYDALFPNSQTTRARLEALVPGVAQRVAVTGVALRDTMCVSLGSPIGSARSILIPSGDDWRKNPEVAVRAHAASPTIQRTRAPLTITGLHSVEQQQALRDLASRNGGAPDLVRFLPQLSDVELRQAYRDSMVVVVTSRVEGFSIPIIEANAQNTAVLASDCAAHRELVPDADDRFGAEDHARLRVMLEEIVTNERAQQARRRRQAGIWKDFRIERVCERFWSGVLTACTTHMSAKVPRGHVVVGRRPSLAFLTPMPPAPSGCADYSAATLRSLASYAQVALFTDTERPTVPPGVIHVGQSLRLAHLLPRFDAVVSVIGNSHFHKREFDLLLEYGAAGIAHDARMLDFYYHLLGCERTVDLASAEARRPVAAEEIGNWLENPSKLPVLFLSEIAAASRPLLVHSPFTAELVERLYGRSSILLPYVPYRRFSDEELSPPARVQARVRCGLPEEALVIATFGAVAPDRALGELVWGVEQLRCWGFDARLVFVGEAPFHSVQMLTNLTEKAEVSPHVSIVRNSRDEAIYRDWLVGADVGVQLRTYGLGGLSGALLDCIAAGLPTVANEHLATAIDAPEYVTRIPDALSAVRLAEAIASIVEAGGHHQRPLARRREMLEVRNFENYSRRLLAALGFG